jgi:hypothetical protein
MLLVHERATAAFGPFWRNSPEQKKAREIGDKIAKFRAFMINGVPQ